jgi:uncharacterized protein
LIGFRAPMRALARGWLLIAATLAVAAPPVCADVQPVPALAHRVTDLTSTLDAGQRQQLEQRLAEFEARKGSQIAILIVPTTEPEDIEQFSIRVAEQWKLGRKGIDDGALLVVAIDDRALRLEVGYGLEGAVPDAIAKRLVSDVITPYFRQGDYYGGLQAGVERLIGVIDGEPLPAPEPGWREQVGSGESMLPLLLMFAIIGGGLLRAIFGRLGGAAVTGGLAGGVVWLIVKVLGISIFAGIVTFVVALLGGLPRRGWVSGGRSGGGGWGSWGGGLGGGGGFGGGGGGFGGGGASGKG